MDHLLAATISIKDNFPPADRFSNAGDLAGDMITIIAGIAGVVAFIFIITGGIRMITASGDPKKIASASATLLYAIIGIAVAILAFVIVRVLQYFLKSDIPIT